MCRSKKIKLLLCITLTVFSCITACASQNNLLSDVGTDISEETDKTEYLNVDILTEKPKDTHNYETHVIQYGTYVEEGRGSEIYRMAYTYQSLKAEVEEGIMTLRSRETKNSGADVNKGDVLATVSMQVDPVVILEAELELQWTKERYERDKENFTKQREKAVEANKLIYDQYEKEADKILIERDFMVWEHTAARYEQQIKDLEERIANLKEWSGKTTILAPQDGYVITPEDSAQVGETVQDGEVLWNIYGKEAEEFFANNEGFLHRYGVKRTLTYQEKQYEGRVFTGTSKDLYGNLDPKDEICLRFEAGSPEEQTILDEMKYGNISGNIYTMENVLLVPVKAVTVEDGIPYVMVVKPDDSLLKTGFISGGKNSKYYWVLSGLEEGTTVLLRQ